jgi:hypothetical protein
MNYILKKEKTNSSLPIKENCDNALDMNPNSKPFEGLSN